MTVFLAHAPADRETAEGLEKFLERRGQFVELDDGQTAMAPVLPSDVLVLLVSKDFVLAPMRLRLEQRALDAWAAQRLLVVKLDKGMAGVGLRDLPAIDASVAGKREERWLQLAHAIGERMGAPTHGEAKPTTRPQASPPPKNKPRPKRAGRLGEMATVLLALPGLGASAVLGAIWLVNRIGPRPGGWPELRAGLDGFGARYGFFPLATEIAFAAALALTGVVFVLALSRLVFRRKPAKVEASAHGARGGEQATVFVSYARANERAVMGVIEGAKTSGRAFRLDQGAVGAGDGWAGGIVDAIGGAGDVVVMCSKAAFESDHVKREIYLADRYKKRLVPVFIEDAAPPEDFEYFFAGVQVLKLFEKPEAERAQALVAALGVTP